MRRTALAVVVLLAATAAQAEAQRGTRQVERCTPGGGDARALTDAERPREQGEYDVVLDVPDLCVERLRLQVDNLDARLALRAQVANLVRVNAGADVGIGTVDLGITGVRAQARLLVDLDNVAFVVERTMAFLDRNPELVTGLFRTTQGALGTVGGVANTALQPGGVVGQTVGVVGRTLENATAPNGVLSQTVNSLGQTVQRVVTTSGSLVEQTLDGAGGVVSQRTLGSITRLPLVNEATDGAGRTVRRVRDQSGRVISYVAGQGGRASQVRVE